jgi:hypothetical protein
MSERREIKIGTKRTVPKFAPDTMASGANERTALLGNAFPAGDDVVSHGKDRQNRLRLEHGFSSWAQRFGVWLQRVFKLHVEKRILFAGFLITLSFSFTQVP